MGSGRLDHPRHFLRRIAPAVALVCLSCTGDIQPAATDGQGVGPDRPGIVPMPGAKPVGTVTQPGNPGFGLTPALPPERASSPSCKAVEPGAQVIRRLTRLEYNKTVRDLLGSDTAPATAFPAENVVHSFDNEAVSLTASPELIEGYTDAAIRLATEAVDTKLSAILGCDPATVGEDVCAGKFVDTFGKRAYRRPLTVEDRTVLMDTYAQGKTISGFKGGIRVALATMLGSVHFLYRVEFGATPKAGQTVASLTQWELATRLSYLIWRTMPDATLLAAAEANKLGTRDEIDAQASRLLSDPKARDTVADFHEQWLHLRGLDGLTKDTKVYPAFHADTPGLMKQETLKFVDHVIWESEGTLSQLYTAPFTFVNTALAQYYGLPAPVGAGFQKVAADTQGRAGFLTQGGLMSVLAQENQTHPIRRGAYVRKELLCQTLQPPPDGVMIVFPPVDPTLTGRERFVQHRADPKCAACHMLTDPIGFGLETFDGIGQYRQKENGKTIDTTGDVVGLKGGGQFAGAAQLGALLAKSEEAGDCAVLAWFRYAYGRDADSVADACTLDVLKRTFAGANFKVKDLIAELAKTDAFQFRRVITPGGAQ